MSSLKCKAAKYSLKITHFIFDPFLNSQLEDSLILVVSTIMSSVLFTRFCIVDYVCYVTHTSVAFFYDIIIVQKMFQSRRNVLFLGEGVKTFLALSTIFAFIPNTHFLGKITSVTGKSKCRSHFE